MPEALTPSADEEDANRFQSALWPVGRFPAMGTVKVL
jgi:hypothetical protein